MLDDEFETEAPVIRWVTSPVTAAQDARGLAEENRTGYRVIEYAGWEGRKVWGAIRSDLLSALEKSEPGRHEVIGEEYR